MTKSKTPKKRVVKTDIIDRIKLLSYKDQWNYPNLTRDSVPNLLEIEKLLSKRADTPKANQLEMIPVITQA